jgi:hypothetical protein
VREQRSSEGAVVQQGAAQLSRLQPSLEGAYCTVHIVQKGAVQSS